MILLNPARMVTVAMATAACLLLPLVSSRAQNQESVNGNVNIGERLFLEKSFAEFYYTNSGEFAL
jgi:hypothetical protein